MITVFKYKQERCTVSPKQVNLSPEIYNKIKVLRVAGLTVDERIVAVVHGGVER